MYQWLDRAPRGRNETGIWWRRHDRVRGLSKSRLSWRKLRDWRLVARGRRGALIAQAAGGRAVAELRRGRTARGFLTAFLLRERARDGNYTVALYTGDPFLPGRRIGHVVVE